MFPPLIDAVKVVHGYEGALGAALGDDLSAPADEPSAMHWRTLDQYATPTTLPAGVEALSDKVSGPKALTRRLSQVGVVANEEAGRQAQPDLKQGQRLVSRDGWLWRWDGYTVSPDAATGTAKRLEQRNRLNEVRSAMDTARATTAEAARTTTQARERVEAAGQAQREAREATREAEKQTAVARERQSALKEKAAARSSRVATLEEQLTSLNTDRDDVAARSTEAAAAVETLPATEDQRTKLEAVRAELGERRAHQTGCQTRHAGLSRAAEDRERQRECVCCQSANLFVRGAANGPGDDR